MARLGFAVARLGLNFAVARLGLNSAVARLDGSLGFSVARPGWVFAVARLLFFAVARLGFRLGQTKVCA